MRMSYSELIQTMIDCLHLTHLHTVVCVVVFVAVVVLVVVVVTADEDELVVN